MVLEDILNKLSKEEKKILLRKLIILPMIESDHFLSQDEKQAIMRAGKKMGFTEVEVEAEIAIQLNEEGAVEEVPQKK